MELGSSHFGRGLALAYGGYLCSRQTGATDQEQPFNFDKPMTADANTKFPYLGRPHRQGLIANASSH